jgi:hypothetical protein
MSQIDNTSVTETSVNKHVDKLSSHRYLQGNKTLYTGYGRKAPKICRLYDHTLRFRNMMRRNQSLKYRQCLMILSYLKCIVTTHADTPCNESHNRCHQFFEIAHRTQNVSIFMSYL